MLRLSLVIPAYNEGDIIRKTVNHAKRYLKSMKYGWEIIVVDDGSVDKTLGVLSKIKNQNSKIKIIKHQVNLGKGAALRSGILNAKGKYIVYTDADLSVSLSHLDEMVKKLDSGCRVVIGSRRLPESKIVVHQPFFREKMGQFFTLLSKIVTGLNLTDFTCGFKGFERKAARKIFRNSVINRWAYDTEVIFLAHKYGLNVCQMPVSWVNRFDTRVRLNDAVISSLRDVIKIRLYSLMGVYEKD